MPWTLKKPTKQPVSRINMGLELLTLNINKKKYLWPYLAYLSFSAETEMMTKLFTLSVVN